MLLSLVLHTYSMRYVLPAAVMMGTAPTYVLAWGAWRLLSALLPARFYREVDDRLYTIYQSMVLFFFENYTGVQVSGAGRCGRGRAGRGAPAWPAPREPAAFGGRPAVMPATGPRLSARLPAGACPAVAFPQAAPAGGTQRASPRLASPRRARPPPCEVRGEEAAAGAGRGLSPVPLRGLRIRRGQPCSAAAAAPLVILFTESWSCVRFAGRGSGRDATAVVLCQHSNGSLLCTLEPCGPRCTSVVLNWQ